MGFWIFHRYFVVVLLNPGLCGGRRVQGCLFHHLVPSESFQSKHSPLDLVKDLLHRVCRKSVCLEMEET